MDKVYIVVLENGTVHSAYKHRISAEIKRRELEKKFYEEATVQEAPMR